MPPNDLELSQKIQRIRDVLSQLTSDMGAITARSPDDEHGLLACQEAIAAVEEGNYGVGCVLIDPRGEVIAKARNQVFYPYFRSAGHAEMILMDAFENCFRDIVCLKHFTLLCTLEPCPMCISRLINSRIGTVKYVAMDDGGGMAAHLDRLPTSFRNLSRPQRFAQANASSLMREVAKEIFLLNIDCMRQRLFQRLPSDDDNTV